MIPTKRNPGNLWVDVFDIYGKSFNLHLFGKEKYRTLTGSIIGIISIISMLTVAIYFLIELFQRKAMTIIFNEDNTMVPVNDLSDVPFLFTLVDYNTNVLDPAGLYTLDVKMLNYKKVIVEQDKQAIKLEIVPVNVEICDETKHSLEKISALKKVNFAKFFCIPPGKYNITLYGKFGDTVNGWSLLAVFLNRCNPKIEKCLSETYTDDVLSNSALNVAFLSNQINPYNIESPGSSKLETATLTMTTGLIKSYYFNIRQIIYETDYGLIFEDRRIENFYSYDSQTFDVNLKNSGLPTKGQTFGYMLFKNSDNVSKYYRTYIKAQAVMANIGGIIKAVMVIAKIISDFLTKRMSYIDISNYIFNFDGYTCDSRNSNSNEAKAIAIHNNSLSNTIANVTTNNYLECSNNLKKSKNCVQNTTVNNIPSLNVSVDSKNQNRNEFKSIKM